jgi:hypothetical protein
MLEKNSPPLLESIPIGLMRLFIQAEIADYLGIPSGRLQDEMASMVVGFAKFVDRDLEGITLASDALSPSYPESHRGNDRAGGRKPAGLFPLAD